MIQDPTRATIAERYGRATESSHLEMVSERTGDVDLLIAAGWAKEGLGTALYRLRVEWDSVRAEQRQAEDNLRLMTRASAKASLEDRPGLRQAAEYAALTARALILIRIGSLHTTREALGRFADIWATRQRYMQPFAVVCKIAGLALDIWLDPACPHCTGRMFVGELGSPQVICKPCRGTGKRDYLLHESEAGHNFGRSLLVEMDRKTDHVDRTMRRYLSGHANGKPPHQEAVIRDLKKRLEDLRSARAQED